ncbi:hypothetical protein [Ruminococcus albus]|jgi:hypothetical protein|uniref:Uncharacterized protein n=1 Tax=Ruminococcus albus (strain ATCC 27210 / DSM 20455 / JCM 14654 / NCDO 2250 / 7) TaxID=697329 RepID=E6UGR1_RUMA7|nr:hypothetical protein [Ruminococcus albus]ADU23723.1 hypothetical protein Rumal_3260 [Ruminococcus albus 7 = DSM 20455]
MKKFGDFILALGIVAFLVVIADLYFPNSKLITEGIIGVFIICGVLLLMLIGIILRNIGKGKNKNNNPNNPQ